MLAVLFAIALAVVAAVTVFLIRKEPRRILNAYFVELILILIYCVIAATTVESDITFAVSRALMYVWCALLFLFGIILLIDFVLVIRKEGKSLPNILPLFFGVLTLFAAVAQYRNVSYGASGSEMYVRFVSVIYNLSLFVPLAMAAILVYSLVYLFLPKSKNPGYIIVLGCSIRKNGEVTPLLRGRVDKALSWYHKCGSHARLVVSGGQGKNEVISEAQAMKNYLLSQGITEDEIILEDKSVNTRENLLFSKKCIEEDGRGGDILICTSNYHVLRAVFLAQALKFNAQGIGGRTALYYLPVAFLREYMAMIFQYKYYVLAYVVLAIVFGWALL